MQSPHCGKESGLWRAYRYFYFWQHPMPLVASTLLDLPSPTSINPIGFTKVHMRSQGLGQLVGMWGPYNLGLRRSPHIAMKLSAREQQLSLPGSQKTGSMEGRSGLSPSYQPVIISSCISYYPQARSKLSTSFFGSILSPW